MRFRPFAEAELWLTDALRSLPGVVSTACLGTPAEAVVLPGWDRLDARLTRLVERGTVVAAVGLDLSNYHDAEGADWWDKEPMVEVPVYTDESFPFSTSSTAEILQA